MIKKIVLTLMAMMFLFVTGCCERTALDGTVTKSFSNCLSVVENKVCTPGPAVIEGAKLAVPVLTLLVGVLLPGSTLFASATAALDTAQLILSGSCVLVSQLNNLITVLSTPEALAVQTQLQMNAAKSKMAVPKRVNVQVFEDWKATAKP